MVDVGAVIGIVLITNVTALVCGMYWGYYLAKRKRSSK